MVETDGAPGNSWRGIIQRALSGPAQARRVLGQLRRLPLEEERRLEQYASERVETLRTLSSLDAETRSRIEPIVASAARTSYIRKNRSATFQAFRAEHPIFRWLLNLATVAIIYLAVGWWALSHPFEKVPAADRSNALFGTGVTFAILSLLARRAIGRREGYSGKIQIAACIFGMVCLITITRDWWLAQVLKVTALPEIQAWRPGFRPVSDMAGSVMLKRSVTCLLRLSILNLLYEFGRAVVLAGQTAKSGEYASATVLNSVLEIAAQLETTTRAFDRQAETPAQQGPTLSYSYLWLPDRSRLVELLEATARFVETYWGKNNRVSDHGANLEIQRVAEGIAAALRRWKPPAAVGGSENLQQMRSAFAIALTNCADGEWASLATEVSPREVLSKRLTKSARRILALSVLTAAILAVLLRPFGWTQGLKDPAVGASFMLAAAFIAGFFDPTIYDRMAPVAKLGSDMLTKRGS